MNLFKRKPPYSPAEIAEYVQSLNRITMLRDKSSGEEKQRYTYEIGIMQKMLEIMLEANGEGK